VCDYDLCGSDRWNPGHRGWPPFGSPHADTVETQAGSAGGYDQRAGVLQEHSGCGAAVYNGHSVARLGLDSRLVESVKCVVEQIHLQQT